MRAGSELSELGACGYLRIAPKKPYMASVINTPIMHENVKRHGTKSIICFIDVLPLRIL